ncbi:MAG: hydrophobe/amphiphile efflux-3 (HAE3) family transporter [Haloarculaceae archaeon]
MPTDFGQRVRDGLEATGRYAAGHQRQVIVVVAVTALVALAVGLAGIQMSMGMTLYIEDDSQAANDWETLKDDFGAGNNVFVLVKSGELHDPETIRAIDRLDRRYGENVDEIQSVTSLADVVRQGNGGTIPQTETGVRQAIERVEAQNPEAAEMVGRLQPESGTTIILATYGNVDTFDRGNFLPQRDSDIIYNEVRQETNLAPSPPGVETTVTGQPVFENAAFGLMLPEMIVLFAGAFALIFAVVYLVMREKVERGWHVFLPLTAAMTALVYMTGAMGVLGYNFNAIMLGVMPIALGLGIDYGLQIHSRYVEERRTGSDSVDAAGLATRTTGRALLIAMGATVIGLGSLLVSAVPPVRQFGVTSAVAVLASMILSVTLLPALLVRYDQDSYTQIDPVGTGSSTTDWLETLTDRITRTVTAGRPLVTLVLALLLVTGGAYAYPQVEPRQEMMDFWPQDLDAKNDIDRLSDTVDSPKVIYVMVNTDQAYDPETFRDVASYQRLMLENDRVNAVQSPVSAVQMANGGQIPESEARLDQVIAEQSEASGMMGVRDPAETPNRLLLTFYVDDIEGELVRTLITEFDNNAELTLGTAEDVRITGKPVLNRNVIENVTAGLTPMTVLSFTLGLLFLAFAFLSVRVSVTIVASVAASAALLVTGSMYLLAIPWNPLTITMSSLTLGIGVTYGIHIFERYEHEVREHGQTSLGAAATAVAKLSRPIIGSSFTTIFGFGILMASRFPVLANFGKTTVLAIGFALLAAFVILPAVLTVAPVLGGSPETETDPEIEATDLTDTAAGD